MGGSLFVLGDEEVEYCIQVSGNKFVLPLGNTTSDN
jgi:hypothetical protein